MDNPPPVSDKPVGVVGQEKSPESAQPQAGVTPQKPETPVSQPKSRKWLVMVLVGVVLLLVGVGSFWAYGRYKMIGKKSVVAPSSSPSPTIDPTAGWETYSFSATQGGESSFSNFTINHPSDWAPETLNSGAPLYSVSFSKDNAKLTITQANMGGGGCLYPGDPDKEGPYGRVSDFTEVVLSDGTLWRIGEPELNNDPLSQPVTVCERNSVGSFHSITKIGAVGIVFDGQPNQKLLDEIIQMFSTVTFVDQAGSIAGWKRYSSSRYSYSFEYPNNWEFRAWDESDPESIHGTHLLTNYSTTQVEQYMDHGEVDWQKFMGNKPAIKLDLSYIRQSDNPTRNDVSPEEAQLLTESGLQVGSLATEVLRFPEDSNPAIYQLKGEIDSESFVHASIYVYNDPNNKVPSSSEWKDLAAIFSTFKFVE